MTKKTKTKGLPKSVQEALERDDELVVSAPAPAEESLEEFINGMHGDGSTAIPIEGFPTKEYLQDTFQTKSAIIRYLINQGYQVKDIAKHLGMRYQHVRNVAKSELKRGPNEDWRKPITSALGIPNPKDFKPPEN